MGLSEGFPPLRFNRLDSLVGINLGKNYNKYIEKLHITNNKVEII